MPKDPWSAYRKTATQTASPGHLVLMLFDGAIRFLNNALAGFDHNDPLQFHQTVNNNILRGQEIINELLHSLDVDAGGELAEKLKALYLYFDLRLQESNIHKTSAGVQEVIQRLTVIRNSWDEMLQNGGALLGDSGERMAEFSSVTS